MQLNHKTSARAHSLALIGTILSIAFLAVPEPSRAQDYPTRPVKLIVPYAPGGIPDSGGRLVAEKLTEYFGKPFVVENRAGAGGTLGADAVVKSKPDGYTLMLGATGTLAISPTLYKSLPFKPNDLAPISLIGAFDYVMLTAPALSSKSLRETVDLAKGNPDKLSIASSGLGSEHHLLIERFKLLSGAPLTHIPYKGFSQGVSDVMAGRVELMFGSVSAATPYVQEQKLGALAVTGPQRSKLLPTVPTFSELGYPDMQMVTWIGLLAPAATPEPIVRRLTAAMEKITQSEDLLRKLPGMIPMEPGPKAFADKLQSDTKYWQAIIEDSKIPQIEQ